MIVSVQRGMNSIKEMLEYNGHKVVYSDEYDHAVDAIIYFGPVEGHMPNSFSAPEANAAHLADYSGLSSISHGNRFNRGAIEINASGRSFQDIEQMLRVGIRANYF